MARYRVGYFVGSLSSTSINRELSRVLVRLAPDDLEFTEIPIGNLPLYSQDYDANYPPEAIALKDAIHQSQAVLFVTRSTTARYSGRRDRGIHRPDRHRVGPAEPACRTELLQRSADDRPGGVHPVHRRAL